MNWEALGALAESLGAVGVIVTLVYLAFQIRQNTTAIQGQADMDYTQEIVARTARLTNDPKLQSLFLKPANHQSMTKEENVTYCFIVSEFFHLADGCYRRYESGLMTKDTFETTVVQGVISFFEVEIVVAWWDFQHAATITGFSGIYRKTTQFKCNLPVER